MMLEMTYQISFASIQVTRMVKPDHIFQLDFRVFQVISVLFVIF